MNSLIRRKLDNLQEPLGTLDDLFRGFFVRPLDFAAAPQIRVDVKEDDKAYTVHAELAGVKKDDIRVHVDGDLLSISADVKQDKETREGDRVLHSERYFGQVTRSFRLGQNIDEAATTASYKDGVLELVLPKKPAAEKRRQIEIH
ncbi:Hsp20/alpha crystallin family protein [Chitinilyticum piscinae]|uniref:Hsp20/alpha crystallin family protein n=1 Tax=Chitinilyticum piscinae TaxID=2866724 RepID=A0A8J7KGU8_9NEIS|nr:Hsp20/alpha crystallin family protein [Chitinilyticum piscinae]MBE9610734.1 Hsp20/alpha crystallin family protein [Chitinilyticum piscinae]